MPFLTQEACGAARYERLLLMQTLNTHAGHHRLGNLYVRKEGMQLWLVGKVQTNDVDLMTWLCKKKEDEVKRGRRMVEETILRRKKLPFFFFFFFACPP